MSDPNSVAVINQAEGTIRVKSEATRYGFYSDCSEEDIAFASARLCPEALIALAAPVAISQKKFGSVPRVYIETTEDRMVMPQAQMQMYTGQPCRKVFSTATGHSPFFNAPDKLAQILLKVEE